MDQKAFYIYFTDGRKEKENYISEIWESIRTTEKGKEKIEKRIIENIPKEKKPKPKK